MKKTLIALTAMAALGLSMNALADEATAKAAGCFGKCHDMNKEKGAPAYKEIAKKFKGKDAATILEAYKKNPDHKDNKATPEQVQKVTSWILTL